MRNRRIQKSITLLKGFTFFEPNNPSSIFQDIYNKTKKNENQNFTNINKTDEFLNLIENMRLKEEMVENENDYIIKESRKEIKFNEEMLYLFGRNRSNRKKSKRAFKIKLDKKIFLNPLEKKEKKHLFTRSKSNANILKLPIITKKNHLFLKNLNSFKPKNKNFNSEVNILKLNLNDSDTNSINDNSRKLLNNNFTHYFQNNKNKSRNENKKINSFLTTSNSRNFKSVKNSSRKVSNISNQNKIFWDIDILNDFTIKKKIKKPLINLLDNINEELKSDAIKHKIYFRKNDYGCELSKFKINYLEKHFFQ